jgi:hypothetical protein
MFAKTSRTAPLGFVQTACAQTAPLMTIAHSTPRYVERLLVTACPKNVTGLKIVQVISAELGSVLTVS